MSYITHYFVFYNCLTTSVNPWNHRDIKQCRLFYSELQKLQIQEDLLVSKLDFIASSSDVWPITENIWKKMLFFSDVWYFAGSQLKTRVLQDVRKSISPKLSPEWEWAHSRVTRVSTYLKEQPTFSSSHSFYCGDSSCTIFNEMNNCSQ